MKKATKSQIIDLKLFLRQNQIQYFTREFTNKKGETEIIIILELENVKI